MSSQNIFSTMTKLYVAGNSKEYALLKYKLSYLTHQKHLNWGQVAALIDLIGDNLREMKIS
jgi:hypothetical protein